MNKEEADQKMKRHIRKYIIALGKNDYIAAEVHKSMLLMYSEHLKEPVEHD